jgi:hypothetical protein
MAANLGRMNFWRSRNGSDFDEHVAPYYEEPTLIRTDIP